MEMCQSVFAFFLHMSEGCFHRGRSDRPSVEGQRRDVRSGSTFALTCLGSRELCGHRARGRITGPRRQAEIK